MYYTQDIRKLNFSQPKHHLTGVGWRPGDDDIKGPCCGVAHINWIDWHCDSRRGRSPVIKDGDVNLYITPFKDFNEKKGETGTKHRQMMEDLSLWKSFEKLKSKARDKRGNHREKFDFSIAKEQDLYFGFTRKNNAWYSTSCTLNTWIYPPIRIKDNPAVVKNAGIKKSDISKNKVDMINVIPIRLWEQILPVLQYLTPSDGQIWTYEWATQGRNLKGRDAACFEKEELERMRRLIFHRGLGSSLYLVSLGKQKIGSAGLSAVRALATVLQEEVGRKEKLSHCSQIRWLNLRENDLTDEHIVELAPVFVKCTMLERLHLGSNMIGERGCTYLCSSLPNSLRFLNLGGNKSISKDQCKAVYEHLECRPWTELDARRELGLPVIVDRRTKEEKQCDRILFYSIMCCCPLIWIVKVILYTAEFIIDARDNGYLFRLSTLGCKNGRARFLVSLCCFPLICILYTLLSLVASNCFVVAAYYQIVVDYFYYNFDGDEESTDSDDRPWTRLSMGFQKFCRLHKFKKAEDSPCNRLLSTTSNQEIEIKEDEKQS